jgi:hypothetical protein
MLSYLIVTLLILFSNSSPLGLIEQTSLGKFSFLVAIKIESSWDRPVVPGFDAKEDDPKHGQGMTPLMKPVIRCISSHYQK